MENRSCYILNTRSDDNSSQIFLRFVTLVQQHCRQHRDLGFYADRLCITPKYLSQVSKKVTNIPASEWVAYYATSELVALLNNNGKATCAFVYPRRVNGEPAHYAAANCLAPKSGQRRCWRRYATQTKNNDCLDMIKMYVMQTCPDCEYVERQVEGNPNFEVIDIGKHVRNLKEFLKLRDTNPCFRV